MVHGKVKQWYQSWRQFFRQEQSRIFAHPCCCGKGRKSGVHLKLESVLPTHQRLFGSWFLCRKCWRLAVGFSPVAGTMVAPIRRHSEHQKRRFLPRGFSNHRRHIRRPCRQCFQQSSNFRLRFDNSKILFHNYHFLENLVPFTSFAVSKFHGIRTLVPFSSNLDILLIKRKYINFIKGFYYNF